MGFECFYVKEQSLNRIAEQLHNVDSLCSVCGKERIFICLDEPRAATD